MPQSFQLQFILAPLQLVSGVDNANSRREQLVPTHKGRGGQGCHVVVAGAGSRVGQVAIGGLEAPLWEGEG